MYEVMNTFSKLLFFEETSRNRNIHLFQKTNLQSIFLTDNLHKNTFLDKLLPNIVAVKVL
jgi:hypothetical protein